ncbi:MAG TPA: tyrosine-protein phosphatase [Abditibacteriaceae bacterium]
MLKKKRISPWTWPLLTLALLMLGLMSAGMPGKPHGKPLNLEHNGVHAPYNIQNEQGKLLFYNFRAVEPGVLYRGSGFLRNRSVVESGVKKKKIAAFDDSQAFELLRSKGIRTVVTLQEPADYYAERGYFDYWGKKTGYKINVVRMHIKNGHAYDQDVKQLAHYPEDQRRFGLRAAAEFIELVRDHKLGDGAIYLHCDAGKDRTGVVAAGYELWRNRGLADRDTLWKQVMDRYLVSNVVIERDKEAGAFAGGKQACGPGEEPGYVCRNWLEPLRPQLELIAQM